MSSISILNASCPFPRTYLNNFRRLFSWVIRLIPEKLKSGRQILKEAKSSSNSYAGDGGLPPVEGGSPYQVVSVETEFRAPISAGGLGKIVPPMAHQKQLFLTWLWASDPLSVNAFYES